MVGNFFSRCEIKPLIEREERLANINFDGTVRLNRPLIATIPCPMDIQSFPYDMQVFFNSRLFCLSREFRRTVQMCTTIFGSWMYSVTEIQLHSMDDERSDKATFRVRKLDCYTLKLGHVTLNTHQVCEMEHNFF